MAFVEVFGTYFLELIYYYNLMKSTKDYFVFQRRRKSWIFTALWWIIIYRVFVNTAMCISSHHLQCMRGFRVKSFPSLINRIFWLRLKLIDWLSVATEKWCRGFMIIALKLITVQFSDPRKGRFNYFLENSSSHLLNILLHALITQQQNNSNRLKLVACVRCRWMASCPTCPWQIGIAWNWKSNDAARYL